MWVAPGLLGISLLDAALLGSVLGAVSPAVVVPLMIDFMDRGRGTRKGIPTLILGASSVDDVFVIVLFTIFLGMYGVGEVHILAKLAQIPVSIVLGIAVGLVPGFVLLKLFQAYDWRPPKRTIVVLGVAIFLTWLESVTERWVPVASLLGVMAIGFVILEKSEPIAHLISQKLKKLWVFAELLLFVLVGAQVNIHVAWDAGLAGTVVIFTGLAFRSIGTYLSLVGTPLTVKEKLFCVVAYIPKATVQAAIGAVPLAAGIPAAQALWGKYFSDYFVVSYQFFYSLVVFKSSAFQFNKIQVYRRFLNNSAFAGSSQHNIFYPIMVILFREIRTEMRASAFSTFESGPTNHLSHTSHVLKLQ